MRRALLPLLLPFLLALGCRAHSEVSGANPTGPARPPAEQPAKPAAIAAPIPTATASTDDLPPLPSMGPSTGETPDEFFKKARLAEALLLLESARQANPDRIEGYYNQGVMLHEYASYFHGNDVMKAIARAQRLLQIFVARAGDSPEHADAVRLAKGRLHDIEDMTTCHFGPEAERRRQEEEKRQRALEEEAQ